MSTFKLSLSDELNLAVDDVTCVDCVKYTDVNNHVSCPRVVFCVAVDANVG